MRFLPDGTLDATAIAIDSTGALDSSFATSGTFTDIFETTDEVYTAIQSDENILMTARLVGDTSLLVIRITPQGMLDNTFGTNGYVSFTFPGSVVGQVRGIIVLSDGRILLHGYYYTGNFDSLF